MSTRLCVLTPRGRGAVAVVAVEGPNAVSAVDRFFQAANKHALPDQPIGRIVYGHWGSSAGEDLIVCRRDDQSLEIHCHGGRQSSEQLVANLSEVGCQRIESDDWLTRQYDCPLVAAAHAALARATTYRAASILLDQYHGALRRELGAIVAALAGDDAQQAATRIEQLLQVAEFGQHLTEPWQVVIAGQPNVGKSSLINALVGYERAIVYDQPGTTRDVVSSTTAVDGWPVQLNDTAGLHDTTDAIETAGMALARERLLAADLVVWVLDAIEVSQTKDKIWHLAEQQAEAVGIVLEREQMLLVINKIDLVHPTGASQQGIGTAAIAGDGIEQLLAEISVGLVPVAPAPAAAVPFTREQVSALQAALSAVASSDLARAEKTLRGLLG
ncbi:MAG: GTPase [Bythopirellula sp.]